MSDLQQETTQQRWRLRRQSPLPRGSHEGGLLSAAIRSEPGSDHIHHKYGIKKIGCPRQTLATSEVFDMFMYLRCVQKICSDIAPCSVNPDGQRGWTIPGRRGRAELGLRGHFHGRVTRARHSARVRRPLWRRRRQPWLRREGRPPWSRTIY